MKDLLIGTSVTQTDDTSPFTVGAKYAIKSISSDAFELKDFLFDLTISNLDRQFVEEYYQMSQSFATMQFGMDPEMFGKLQSLAYKFLSASPGIAVKPLKFTFNDGPVVVNLNIIADGSQIKDASQLTLQNMQSLRSILDATADVEVGKAMALETAKSQIKTRMRTSMAAQGQEVTDEQLNQVADQQAPAMLSSLIAQGFVVETDTTYRSSAKVVKGVLEVNGKAMPF
ncbi:MAG: YdgA family protein, partial [Gammaproteobacteria bacterium]|nr:YdgA family protein [Gammaproteobacteria bacterium]